jgi:hypothetical protein
VSLVVAAERVWGRRAAQGRVNGDGQCSITEDEVFAWAATVYSGSRTVLVRLSPDSPHCPGLSHPGGGPLAAAQYLCPSVGECLPSVVLQSPRQATVTSL